MNRAPTISVTSKSDGKIGKFSGVWLVAGFNVIDVPVHNTFFQVFLELMQERLITLNHNLYPAIVQIAHKTGNSTDAPGDSLRMPAKTDSLNRTGNIKMDALLLNRHSPHLHLPHKGGGKSCSVLAVNQRDKPDTAQILGNDTGFYLPVKNQFLFPETADRDDHPAVRS